VKTDFIELINKALSVAEPLRSSPEQNDRLERIIGVLNQLKERVDAGELEPSGGASLGLARDVADWIEPLDSPFLAAVGEIENYYKENC
jgi:hypothetical protein